jgi:hypothetical protein
MTKQKSCPSFFKLNFYEWLGVVISIITIYGFCYATVKESLKTEIELISNKQNKIIFQQLGDLTTQVAILKEKSEATNNLVEKIWYRVK